MLVGPYLPPMEAGSRSRRLFERPVSTETEALTPEESPAEASASASLRRTGTRCVTFTQFPVAFCAGSKENSAPVPAPIASTVACTLRPGSASKDTSAD